MDGPGFRTTTFHFISFCIFYSFLSLLSTAEDDMMSHVEERLYFVCRSLPCFPSWILGHITHCQGGKGKMNTIMWAVAIVLLLRPFSSPQHNFTVTSGLMLQGVCRKISEVKRKERS
ncbi:hypothetical protein N657DRAFT_97426 [Parathielavia appendiculata]|uniref:Uncharacterized protein n=1 Tax=Parathielavia appendiculata TaxID=2587402 RepID=A0AAN6TW67_9PEZI|nr:hypothetical protein N657DRAFT_97426 [Parathielavia appendiculata]